MIVDGDVDDHNEVNAVASDELALVLAATSVTSTTTVAALTPVTTQ
jgi:hypothetical protein